MHGPMDAAEKLKLLLRVGDLDLPGRRKRYTTSPMEEEVDAQNRPCGKAIVGRAHVVAEFLLYKNGTCYRGKCGT